MSVALGTLPDWFSGLGAAGALVFAAGALKTASKANKKQDEQIKYLARAEVDRAEREKRAQASQIAFWLQAVDLTTPRLLFSNTSGLPIYEVHVVVQAPWGTTTTKLGTLGPTSAPMITPKVIGNVTRSSGGLVSHAQFDGPSHFNEDRRSEFAKGVETWTDLIHGSHVKVGFTFRDVNDEAWYRTVDGHLNYSDDSMNIVVKRLARSMGAVTWPDDRSDRDSASAGQ